MKRKPTRCLFWCFAYIPSLGGSALLCKSPAVSLLWLCLTVRISENSDNLCIRCCSPLPHPRHLWLHTAACSITLRALWVKVKLMTLISSSTRSTLLSFSIIYQRFVHDVWSQWAHKLSGTSKESHLIIYLVMHTNRLDTGLIILITFSIKLNWFNA